MRVRLREQITGYRNEVAWPPPGTEIDLPDLEAAKLCAAGRATPVKTDPPVETRKKSSPKSAPRAASTS
jgi:hypothetical protein